MLFSYTSQMIHTCDMSEMVNGFGGVSACTPD